MTLFTLSAKSLARVFVDTRVNVKIKVNLLIVIFVV